MLNAKGWLSTLCCWEAAVHTLGFHILEKMDKMDVKMMMMIVIFYHVSSLKAHLNTSESSTIGFQA